MDQTASLRLTLTLFIVSSTFLLIVQGELSDSTATKPLIANLNHLKLDSAIVDGATVTSRKPKNELGGQNCTNHLQIIDRCSSLAAYSYTTGINQYPNNTIELKASCDRIVGGLKCLKVYGKCLSPISRRVLTTFSGSRSRHSKKLCSNVDDAKAIEFVKASECVIKANKKSMMMASERELISSIQTLALNATMKWDDRFHGACCAASAYKTKALKDLEPECTKYKDVHEDMLNSLVGELLESACPEQARLNDICVKLAKLILPTTWKAVSLTGAALDLIVALSDNPRTA